MNQSADFLINLSSSPSVSRPSTAFLPFSIGVFTAYKTTFKGFDSRLLIAISAPLMSDHPFTEQRAAGDNQQLRRLRDF